MNMQILFSTSHYKCPRYHMKIKIVVCLTSVYSSAYE